jgi:hypothetical protein
MGLIKLLTYLFVFKTYKSQCGLGYDERYPLIENKSALDKIIDNLEKKELLNYLQSNKINTLDKINKINEFYKNDNVRPANLLHGLDW